MPEKDDAAALEVQFDVPAAVQKLMTDLKRRTLVRSHNVAVETLRLLERLVTSTEWASARDLMAAVRGVGRRLAEPAYAHSVAGNMARRVLRVIRDEYCCALGDEEAALLDPDESLQKMLVEDEREEVDFSKKPASLGRSISANIRELMEECERSAELIAAEAAHHIHPNEVVMTYGASRTVERFLCAARDRRPEVVVVAGAARLGAAESALRMRARGLQVTLVPDTNVLHFLPVVHRVVVGTHAVLGNGGLKAAAGVHPLAVFADYHKKPFYALAPLFKLTPQFVTSSDQEGFNHMLPPDDPALFEDPLLADVEVVNPAFDYVPPDLVKLIIFNNGANPPSYVYRPLQELYHTDDHDLS